MSRLSKNARQGPQLPPSLRQELGLSQHKKRQRTQIADRKARRQHARQTKNSQKHSLRSLRHDAREHPQESATEDGMVDDESENEQYSPPPLHMRATKPVTQPEIKRHNFKDPSPTRSRSPPRSPSFGVDDDDLDMLSRGSRDYSPEVVLDASSKPFRDRQAEEDAEILALEKRLGISQRKKRVFGDGLDDLLQDLDATIDSKQRKSEEDEWLEQKRRKAQAKSAPSADELDSLEEPDGDEDLTDADGSEEEDGQDTFAGFEVDEVSDMAEDSSNHREESTVRRQRENPYVAPTTNSGSTPKYIPPSRRNLPHTDTEKLDSLRRQVQGSLNKLSEANMLSIVDEVQKLYQANPRQNVNDVLISLILTAFSIPSALQNTFIILHAAFVAALYRLQGADFGAEMLSRLVVAFDQHHRDSSSQGKESLNLTSLLANLFTFGVVSSSLIFDHVKLLLADFGENSAELLLRIMRDCGPQLRSDDPTSLKGIVQMMNEVSAMMTSNGQTINVRTRVMMDTITDLKNNKIRQATNAAGPTGEHLTRMRKALGSLSSRQLRASEPIGITRADILNSNKKGKWWLVGASWKGREPESKVNPISPNASNAAHDEELALDHDDETLHYPTLFIHYKITSPVHRSIFVALTSAVDGTDALQRLAKLRLTRKQELEIPPVILRTCRAEPQFNPFYGVVSKLLLREKRYKMSFSIALWKFLEMLGEKRSTEDTSDVEDGNHGDVRTSEIVNVALLYAYLIAKGSLSLDVLKTLSIGFTKENASLFLEMLFIALLTHKMSEEKVVEIFASGIDPSRSKAVAYFLQKTVRKSDLVHEKTQKMQLKRRTDMAIATLEANEMNMNFEE